jgi:hypothetical protein
LLLFEYFAREAGVKQRSRSPRTGELQVLVSLLMQLHKITVLLGVLGQACF